MSKRKKIKASVIDVFCGAGGLSYGFVLEGFSIAAGIDIDEACRYPFEKNNQAKFIRRSVSTLKAREVKALFLSRVPRILVGCAPCQPFSTYKQKHHDPKWRLLSDFGRLIDRVRPDVISMENVPRLLKYRGGRLFRNFVSRLRGAGYHVAWNVLYCPDFGVPQMRSRLVLVASRFGPITMPKPTRKPANYRTVANAIRKMSELDAGSIDESDLLHRASRLSPLNLRRMRAARPGGTWQDWSEILVAGCHKRNTGKRYFAVYGRMPWNQPSPTITTEFYGFGSGRFGHPQQDRAISLREGALLQGFPRGYEFTRPNEPVRFKSVGRLVGNAVPVDLARAIARSVKAHLKEYA